jgi:hypothetical protein
MGRAIIIDVLAIIWWPLAAATAGIYFIIRKPELRSLFATLAVCTILLPLGLVLWVAGNETMPVLFDAWVGSVLVGAACLYLSWMFSRQPESRWTDRHPNSRSHTKRSAVLLLLGLGIVFGLWGGWPLVGDYLFLRYSVEGTVQDLHRKYRAQGYYDFIARIGGRDYRVPRRTFRQLSVGDTVRAQVGRGSGYLYNIETGHPS